VSPATVGKPLGGWTQENIPALNVGVNSRKKVERRQIVVNVEQLVTTEGPAKQVQTEHVTKN